MHAIKAITKVRRALWTWGLCLMHSCVCFCRVFCPCTLPMSLEKWLFFFLLHQNVFLLSCPTIEVLVILGGLESCLVFLTICKHFRQPSIYFPLLFLRRFVWKQECGSLCSVVIAFRCGPTGHTLTFSLSWPARWDTIWLCLLSIPTSSHP